MNDHENLSRWDKTKLNEMEEELKSAIGEQKLRSWASEVMAKHRLERKTNGVVKLSVSDVPDWLAPLGKPFPIVIFKVEQWTNETDECLSISWSNGTNLALLHIGSFNRNDLNRMTNLAGMSGIEIYPNVYILTASDVSQSFAYLWFGASPANVERAVNSLRREILARASEQQIRSWARSQVAKYMKAEDHGEAYYVIKKSKMPDWLAKIRGPFPLSGGGIVCAPGSEWGEGVTVSWHSSSFDVVLRINTSNDRGIEFASPYKSELFPGIWLLAMWPVK